MQSLERFRKADMLSLGMNDYLKLEWESECSVSDQILAVFLNNISRHDEENMGKKERRFFSCFRSFRVKHIFVVERSILCV